MEKEEFLVRLEQVASRKRLNRELFQSVVLDFYSAHGRDFAWRRTKDPYEILVSEVMLQQTQTERVAQRYPKFLRRFPTAKALSKASLAEVLSEWEGLGYYRRARNLHAAAVRVAEEHRGKVPVDYDTLLTLPGIGSYTAAAVSTFASGAIIPFIETNIRTVFLHLFYKNTDSVPDSDIISLVGETLDPSDTRRWFYALMDLGVLIKQTRGNPNARSKHHRAQTTFSGSKRQMRAAILRYVVKQQQVTKDELTEKLHANQQHFDSAITELLEEGFIVRSRNGIYSVAG